MSNRSAELVDRNGLSHIECPYCAAGNVFDLSDLGPELVTLECIECTRTWKMQRLEAE